MTSWIVAWSMKFRLLVVAIAALTLVVGVSQLRSMPVDVLPEYAPVTVEVQTEALGLSLGRGRAADHRAHRAGSAQRRRISSRLRSQSVHGHVADPPSCSIRAPTCSRRGRSSPERMTQAHALPNVSKPPQMLQPLVVDQSRAHGRRLSKTLSPIQMSVLARWTSSRACSAFRRGQRVHLGRARPPAAGAGRSSELSAANVSLQQVIDTSGNALWVSPLTYLEASTPGTGGFIDTANQRLGIQHISPITTPESLGQRDARGHEDAAR